MSVKEAIGATVAPLWELHAKAIAKRDALRQELTLVDDDVRQLERMLRLADPDNPAFAKPENGKAKNLSGRPVSEALVDQVHALMWKDSHRTFTITQLVDEMGLSGSSVDNAMTELRARGVVRATGRIPNPAGKGPAVMGFKIGEHVPPPNGKVEQEMIAEVDWVPSGKTLLTLEAARKIDKDTFTYNDLREINPEIPGSQTFIMRDSLVKHGYIEIVEQGKGGHPTVYRLTDVG